MFNKLKKFLKSKRAIGSVGTAIKVVTACVLGATILVGGVALTNDVILPSTSDKTQAIADYEGDGTSGSTGGVAPVSTPIASTITFTISGTEYTAEEGMTWAEWCNSEYNTAGFEVEGNSIVNFIAFGGKQVKYVNANTIVTSGVYYLGQYCG